MREADVIVTTSIGAADPQLLAACGIYAEDEDDKTASKKDEETTSQFGVVREWAPDNLPPLSIPFVIIDEACQTVEPASLIPIVSTNSCRSLVMLGDPCQVRVVFSLVLLFLDLFCVFSLIVYNPFAIVTSNSAK